MRLFDEERSFSLTILGLHRISRDMQRKIRAMVDKDPRVRLVDDEAPWLDIRGDARTPAGTWQAEGDILELHDTPCIAAWFRALADGADTHQELYFEEPYLSLKSVGRIDSGLGLAVTLDGEFRPPWLPAMIGDPPDPSFTIRVTRRMLIDAAASLDTQVRRVLD